MGQTIAAQPYLATERRSATTPSILVAVASYGTKQDHFLARVLAEFLKLQSACRIVVLSDREKPVNGAEVLAGLPTSNPYSLPFAHRKLFAENADKYDLFIYTEDDTLLTAAHIEAFLEVQRHLDEDQIVGFVRSETSPDGQRFITSIHHHFRWLPETTVERGGELFAELSNLHSGCFIATRAQLRRALQSGGFLVPPHDESYGMLESAASDIYRQCGLRRFICVSRIHDFIVPHLANKYFGEMGITVSELEQQIRALSECHDTRDRSRVALYEPQTQAYQFRWSQDLYAKADPMILAAVPPGTRRVLSVGVGSGAVEEALRSKGIEVSAIAVDAVFAGVLRGRGIEAVHGGMTTAMQSLPPGRFDVVLVTDVLHLVDDPVAWLSQLSKMLAKDGRIIIRVDNTGGLIEWLTDLRVGQFRSRWPHFTSTGVQPVSVRRVRRWCRASNLEVTEITAVTEESRRRKLGAMLSVSFESLLANKFLVTAMRA